VATIMTTPVPSIHPRLAFRISLVAGLAILALTVMSALQGPVRPCGDLRAGYAPIVAFELARDEADLTALFGRPGDPCRAQVIEHMDAINWIDVLVFIPLYGVFMAFFFVGMHPSALRLARLGVQITILACLGDYAENTCLMQLTPALDAGSTWLALLPWATGVKWLGLGLAAGVAALIFARTRTQAWWHALAALACVVALAVTIAALAAPRTFGPILSPAIGLSWLAYLVTATVGAFRAGPVQRGETVFPAS
jgi:hypothetical protein